LADINTALRELAAARRIERVHVPGDGRVAEIIRPAGRADYAEQGTAAPTSTGHNPHNPHHPQQNAGGNGLYVGTL
jgi:hypothetical protein